MEYVDFVSRVHTPTKRDYVSRVTAVDKSKAAEIALRFDKDYWDGDRDVGYGGYRYDGRWRAVADAMVEHYGLKSGDRVLDVGCGKGFLLYEFTQAVPGIEVVGLDISEYALEHSKEEVQAKLRQGHARLLPFEDEAFDFVLSVNTLHNLYVDDLWASITEIERVSRGVKHITVEAYRNEQEKVNLLYWQLTCRAFHTPEEWQWLFEKVGYTGDYGCIFFE
ncbi:MAG: class I SAM-dependent methyltransferase [Rhodospirillaceae bacterium]|nr:class I SAM-dependent methyltransferase [Rhodospirillaceae bacterium]